MNKIEYIKQLKKLIKKYHPDLCNNVHLESMYNEITRILVNKLNEIKTNDNAENKNTKEPDYIYYKLGIKYYKNIHPNQFYKRNTDSTFKTKTYDELKLVLNNIYLSFNLSEYFFMKIIKEYSRSPYLEDSKAKVKLLNKLYKSYKDIVFEENKIIDNEKFINEMGLKIL
ncbi:MAG: hypothetical protein FWB95_07695 [Treponema sp.]|nr:hypothetical protein [Treponema sp.]